MANSNQDPGGAFMLPSLEVLERIVVTYCEAWSVSDRGRRDLLLRQSVVDDVLYLDPTVEVAGVSALGAHIGSVVARYPGARITITSALDIHHRFLRFAWQKTLADGSSLPEGVDVCEVADDGRLQKIVGFFGPLRR